MFDNQLVPRDLTTRAATRRRVLAAIGTAATPAVAGCAATSGGDESDDSTDDTTDDTTT